MLLARFDIWMFRLFGAGLVVFDGLDVTHFRADAARSLRSLVAWTLDFFDAPLDVLLASALLTSMLLIARMLACFDSSWSLRCSARVLRVLR